MATYNVTTEAETLLAAGWTPEQIKALHARIVEWTDRWDAQNRSAESAITDAAARVRAQQARAQAIAGGRIEWVRYRGGWCIRGANLATGDVVTVTRRSGDTSRVRVGQILTQDGGLTIAVVAEELPAAIPSVVPPVADRTATAVADMLGVDAPRATGRCHYCGLPLTRKGQCPECI
jgi:hypothetical protein